MAQILSISIDLNKIDKSRIVTKDKNGEPFKNGAKYYELTVTVNDTPDKFGKDVQVAQAQTADERKEKKPRVFLGGGKTVWSSLGNVPSASTPSTPAKPSNDLPF